MKKEYVTPAIRDIGSLQELTQQFFHKINNTPDVYTASTDVIGSLTPAG